MRLPWVVVWAGLALGGGPARGQTFLDAPALFTRSPEVFRGVFAGSRCGTVRALIFGDSQETCPGGSGAVYVPRLNYEFWNRIGNVPETPWIQLGWNTGGEPPADWLNRSGNPALGVSATRLSRAQTPPGMRGMKTSTTNGNNINGNQIYGNMVMLQHDAANVLAGAGLSGRANYFDPGAEIYLDVMGVANASSGEVRVRATYSPTSQSNYFQPTTAWFTTSMGLQRDEPGILTQRVGPIPNAPIGYYLQTELSGTDSASFTDVLSVRFVNASDPRGWSITSLSEGGYMTLDLQHQHGGCGPVISVMAPDVVFLCFGANDGNGYTPEMVPITVERFRADVESLIAFLRTWTRADLPVILLADPFRTDFHSEEAREVYDALPAVSYAIAQADPLVCAVNSRLLTHDAGWTAQNAGMYLSDTVHYTPAGAALKAELEAAALFDAFMPESADCNANGTDDHCDILSGTSLDVNADGVPDECACEPDINADGSADQADLACVILLISGDPTCSARDPDFNGDGSADQGDVASLIWVLAGGECP